MTDHSDGPVSSVSISHPSGNTIQSQSANNATVIKDQRVSGTVYIAGSTDGLTLAGTLGGGTNNWDCDCVWAFPVADSGTITITKTGALNTTFNSKLIKVESTAPDTASFPVDYNILEFRGVPGSTVTNSTSTWNGDVDAANDLHALVSYDATNFSVVADATIQRNTDTGSVVYTRFVGSRTDLSKEDKLYEWATLYNWY